MTSSTPMYGLRACRWRTIFSDIEGVHAPLCYDLPYPNIVRRFILARLPVPCGTRLHRIFRSWRLVPDFRSASLTFLTILVPRLAVAFHLIPQVYLYFLPE